MIQYNSHSNDKAQVEGELPPTLATGNVARRLLGLVREQVIASFWGGSLEASAVFAALRVPTMIYDLLIGGMLSAVLVPVFSAYAAARRDELWRAASVVLSAAAALTGLLAMGVFALAPQIADALAQGLGPEGVAIVARSLRFIAPAVMAFAMAGILTGLLFALERFTLPAASGALYNAALIATVLMLRDRLGVYALPLGVAIGGIVQVLILAPGLRDARLRPALAIRHPVLRRVIVLYLPIGAGLLVSQLQVGIDTRLASLAGDSAFSWMRYATTLIQFPHGLVAVAISLAILPRLSATHARLEAAAFARILARAVRVVLALSLPAAVGLAVLSTPVVGAVFQRGAFTEPDRVAVSIAVCAYLAGLPFAAVDWPLNYAFYARQNTITPAVVGVGSVGVYLVVALLLGPTYNLIQLGPDRLFLGLVLADSAKHLFHALAMLVLVRRAIGGDALRRLGRTALGAGAAAVAMGAVVVLFDRALAGAVGDGLWGWSVRSGLGVAVGAVVYLPLARLFGVEEIAWLGRTVRARLAPTHGPNV